MYEISTWICRGLARVSECTLRQIELQRPIDLPLNILLCWPPQFDGKMQACHLELY